MTGKSNNQSAFLQLQGHSEPVMAGLVLDDDHLVKISLLTDMVDDAVDGVIFIESGGCN